MCCSERHSGFSSNPLRLFGQGWLRSNLSQQGRHQVACSLPVVLVDFLLDFCKCIGVVGQALHPLPLTKSCLFGKMVDGL
ncbi:MAG: hypothetical protein A2V98_14485 [Planctomycetes bacterium RBG_16_64_12]|nr:MAG: hypothetical protein A2V98_14485 [Planctomycetes bacterium RBG_16_64_12]